METSRKRVLALLIVLAAGIFGYSQYASASQIEVDITQSHLLGETEEGSEYNVELQFQNPSLLILTAGETEFFVMSDDRMVGKGHLNPFMLQPLDSTYVSGTFRTDSDDGDGSGTIKITGTTKYDMLITSIDVPFVYYPTAEQAREFIQ